MKNTKQIIGCRKAKKGEDTKGLGMITLGKAKKELYEAGMLALKHDPEAVIEYVIKKALLETAKRKK